jgi:hypothetical protein
MTVKIFGRIHVQKGKAVLHEAHRVLGKERQGNLPMRHYLIIDFRLQLRAQLTGARRRRSDVRDFHRDIETLTL